MPKFNNGRPYHGSDKVSGGKLKGATDNTDYFYFFCPHCDGSEVLRIIEYGEHAVKGENPYNQDFRIKAKYGFTLVFKLRCEKCGLTDFVKVSNTGWQGGSHQDILEK